MKEIVFRDLPILNEPTYRYHILPDGSMIDVFSVRYDCKVDIKTHKYLNYTDEGYDECKLPTFTDLYIKGILDKEGTCIKYNHVYYTDKEKLTLKDIDEIIGEFREKGLNITKEAILHNYKAWLNDEKSGYRDEVNGYHLSSPCGCFPLSFRACNLHEKCSDWQTTYNK